jgi:hypothetical protein
LEKKKIGIEKMKELKRVVDGPRNEKIMVCPFVKTRERRNLQK